MSSAWLGAGDDRLRQGRGTNMQHPTISNIGTFTYTPRLAVTKTCIDYSPAARFLDGCA